MSNNFDENEAGGMAARMGQNASEEDVKNVEQNMDKMNRGPLAAVWDKVVTLWDAFKDPKTPASLKAIIIGGLIYMVCPVDLISDFIPILGLTDDAGVIAMVFRQFMKLGAVALVATSVIKLYKLTKAELEKERLKRKMSKLIVKNLEKGEENYKVKVGLYDEEDNEKEELVFEAEEIGFGIREGLTIHA